jgi:hypothetical protein
MGNVVQLIYRCSLLKRFIGNCNTSKPHRGPLLDPTLSSSLSHSLNPLSLPLQPPMTTQKVDALRTTVNVRLFAVPCLFENRQILLNSVCLPIISAADFVCTLLNVHTAPVYLYILFHHSFS